MSDTAFETSAKHIDETIQNNGSTAARVFEGVIPAFGDAARATADVIRDAGRRASSAISDLGDGVPETREAVTKRVQEQPITALLIAAGIGILAGMLLFRK